MSIDEHFLSLIYREDLTGVRQIISEGASLTDTDSDGRNVLMHTLLSENKNAEIISLLLTNGINVNHKDKMQNWSALAFAARECSVNVISLLLDNGAEIDSQDVFGNTPLWRAVMAKRDEVVKLLVSRGANPDCVNKSGISPFILAQQLGISYFV